MPSREDRKREESEEDVHYSLWSEKVCLSWSSILSNQLHMLTEGPGRVLVRDPIFHTYTHLGMGD